MDSICSMLASLAHSVVSAVATADTLNAPSDMGRWGPTGDTTVTESMGLGSTTSAPNLTPTHAIVVVFFILMAVLSFAQANGGNRARTSFEKPQDHSRSAFRPSEDNDDMNNNGGGGTVF